jgi:ribosomal protein L37AE/L43A
MPGPRAGGSMIIETEKICPRCGGTSWQKNTDGTWHCPADQYERAGTVGVWIEAGHG